VVLRVRSDRRQDRSHLFMADFDLRELNLGSAQVKQAHRQKCDHDLGMSDISTEHYVLGRFE
jgi:hypothetical protein